MTELPEGADVDFCVQEQHIRINFVNGILAGMPPPGHFAAQQLAKGHGNIVGIILAKRNLADAHKHSRNAHAVETHIAGPAHPASFGRLARMRLQDGCPKCSQLKVGREVIIDGRASSAGRIDIDMSHAAVIKIFPKIIGVPGGAGIAPMAMPTPKCQTQSAMEMLFVLGHEASHFHHCGVGRAVVHGPDFPRI